MTEVVIAENIDIVSEDKYKFTIDMVDISTILINIMNTDTGINYKLYIKKDDEWYKNNLHKIQNDFIQWLAHRKFAPTLKALKQSLLNGQLTK